MFRHPSPPRRLVRHSAYLLVLVFAAMPSRAAAQKEEFTKQGFLVTPLAQEPGSERESGRKAADRIRSRVKKLSNGHELDVVNSYAIKGRLEHDGFRADSALDEVDVQMLARYLRADEYVQGRVSSPPEGPARIEAELVLVRNPRVRQPLRAVSAARLDDAADALAGEIVAARVQVIPMRRCENALRDGHGRAAIAAARAGLAAYPDGALVGTCLVWALRATGAPSDEVLSAARRVLAADSVNPYALESAATALDSLRRPGESADMWLRLAATDTTDLELASRVAFALLQGGNAKAAEPFIYARSDAHPDHAMLLWYKWRAANARQNWPRVVEAGESMLVRDSLARADSTTYLRLATAYGRVGNPYKAIETVARGVSLFPHDPSLYALYAQFVRTEADTVLPRGLALFPRDAGLLALDAQALRAQGRMAEALDASRRAMMSDTTLSQGELLVAQGEMDAGRPDSALAALRLALSRGKDSVLVARFLLARGNRLYRAAADTKATADFEVAVRFLSLADSVQSSAQSRFLLGAAALGAAQAALTDAPKFAPGAQGTAVAAAGRSCELARYGSQMLQVARGGLAAGAEVGVSGASESMAYVDQLEPYATRQVAAYCDVSAAGAGQP